MVFNGFLSYLPLIAVVAYTLLLLGIFVRRSQEELQTRWFLAFLAVSIVWQLILFFGQQWMLPRPVPLKVLLIGTLFLGLTTAVYVNWPRQRRWFLMGALAILLTVAADLLLPGTTLIPLLNFQASYRGLVGFAIWFLLSGFIFFKTWNDYRTAQFPWHANRLLFWAIALLITFLGEALLFFQWPEAVIAGHASRLIGILALAYAVSSYRIFDVRTRAQKVMILIVVTLLSALPMLFVLLAIWQIGIWQNWNSGVTILATLITLVISLFLYEPFRSWLQRLADRYLLGGNFDTSQVLRNYSQATSRILDVNQLAIVILGAASELLETKYGALLLINNNDEGQQIEVIPAIGSVPRDPVTFAPDSPFIRAFAQHQPLLQYELDFNRQYANLPAQERMWLKKMAMDVYVPITDGSTLDGLIAMGPKQSGLPYQPDELSLLQTMADQAVIALQNARLYREMEERNEKIKQLNIDLMHQNERLEVMDRVKSDFITIASHELRTPLTQVKGYIDILAAMNAEGILSQEQTREIVGHINRASLQLERLISAMLDASQLEVDGMQLNFMETSLETLVRLAIDPLRTALAERHLTLKTEGLADIPPLHADFKRMVQSLTNIIGNAIKYTPDYGTITISARMVPARLGDLEYVELVVADTGIGIDPKYHELIFEKFFRVGNPQLHSTGSTKFKGAGPGLGLPIARGVIEAHNGRIWVESPGEDEKRLPGSEFHILLPLRQPDTAANGKQAPAFVRSRAAQPT